MPFVGKVRSTLTNAGSWLLGFWNNFINLLFFKITISTWDLSDITTCLHVPANQFLRSIKIRSQNDAWHMCKMYFEATVFQNYIFFRDVKV